MGSTFLTKSEAAEQLGKTQRTVQSYVKSGFIRSERRGKRIMLNAQDVKELAATLGKDMPPMNRKSFWKLWHKFEKLEQDHLLIKEKVGLNDTPFRPEPGDALRLWNEAGAASEAPSLPYEMAELWVSTIMRVDERVLSALPFEKPYLPFLTILLNLTKQISSDPMLPKSIGLQALLARTELARRRLKEAMLVWTETGPSPGAPDLDSPKNRLLRRREEMEAKKKRRRSRDKK